MFRIPNTDLLNAEKALVDLIGNFRLISYEQMITYHILKEKAANKEQVLSKMRHLAVKYHFSCFKSSNINQTFQKYLHTFQMHITLLNVKTNVFVLVNLN